MPTIDFTHDELAAVTAAIGSLIEDDKSSVADHVASYPAAAK
jgi:hypothetical protein